jgi:chromosome segregation ATPase
LKEIINDKKQAEKFLKMQEELKEKKANLLFRKIHDQEQELAEFDAKMDENNKLLEANEVKIVNGRKQIDELTSQLEKIKKELAQRGDAEQQAITASIDKSKTRKMELEGIINNHTRELERIKQRSDSVNKELIDAENAIRTAKAELKSVELKVKSLRKELDDKRQSGIAGEEGQLSKLKESLLAVEEELLQLNNKLMLARQSDELKSELIHAGQKLIAYENN